MKIKKLWLAILTSLAVFGLFMTFTQQAVQAEKVTFAVAPIYPKNQTDSKLGYYDLNIAPGTKQQLAISVENSGSKAMKVKVSPNTAVTNSNGIIDYSHATAKRDSSNKYPFKSLMSEAQEMTVPAKSSRTATFELKAPKKAFDGFILGGFNVTQVDGTAVDKALNKKDGVGLTNKYAYIVGVKLHSSASDVKAAVKPSLKLNKIKAGLSNSHTAILANVQNTKAASIGEMHYKTTITEAGKSKVLYHNDKKGLQMAPNSNFNYAIDLNNKPIKAGKYHIKMVITSNRGHWTLEKDFTITRKESQKYNQKAVELPKDYSWIYYIVIGLMIIIIVLLILILRKRSKKDDDSEA